MWQHNAHRDSLLPLLQGMQYVNHNPCVLHLLTITVLHGDAFTNGVKAFLYCQLEGAVGDETVTLARQQSTDISARSELNRSIPEGIDPSLLADLHNMEGGSSLSESVERNILAS